MVGFFLKKYQMSVDIGWYSHHQCITSVFTYSHISLLSEFSYYPRVQNLLCVCIREHLNRLTTENIVQSYYGILCEILFSRKFSFNGRLKIVLGQEVMLLRLIIHWGMSPKVCVLAAHCIAWRNSHGNEYRVLVYMCVCVLRLSLQWCVDFYD